MRSEREIYCSILYLVTSSNQPSSYYAYLVQVQDRSFQGSHVRDQVFDRVIAYVNYRKATTTSVRGFWSDQECIDQVNEAEKHRVIQSMEYVCTQSAFPVALLSTRIEPEAHLRDLIYILKRGDPPRKQGKGWIPSILNFLNYITSDSWWERDWTFQEDCCISTRTCLLIPHSSSLTELKRENWKSLGNLEEELCQLTNICLCLWWLIMANTRVVRLKMSVLQWRGSFIQGSTGLLQTLRPSRPLSRARNSRYWRTDIPS